MVKGISKHIVIVKNPDKKNFEQAIFVVRGDIFRKSENRRVKSWLRRAAAEIILNRWSENQRTEITA